MLGCGSCLSVKFIHVPSPGLPDVFVSRRGDCPLVVTVMVVVGHLKEIYIFFVRAPLQVLILQVRSKIQYIFANVNPFSKAT